MLFCSCIFSPFSIAITSLGEERANLSAFRTFVRFVLVWFCRFPLPLGVWEGLRFVIVALPGLFSGQFCISCKLSKPFFSGENKENYFKLSSAEILLSIQSVKYVYQCFPSSRIDNTQHSTCSSSFHNSSVAWSTF